jgi:hypothetical protein
MASRLIRVGVCGAIVLSASAACSSSQKKAVAPSTTATTSTTATSTASDSASASTDPAAIALNAAVVSPAEVQQALGLPAAPSADGPGKSSTPQGPLTETGLLGVLPGAGAYKSIFEKAGGSVGANATYRSPNVEVDVAAIKFATAGGAQSFVEQGLTLATVLAKGQTTAHPELMAGVLPSKDRVILRVPPSPLADANKETVATSVVYSNGAFFLISLFGPVGTITDQQVIALARAQDRKWAAARSTLGIG